MPTAQTSMPVQDPCSCLQGTSASTKGKLISDNLEILAPEMLSRPCSGTGSRFCAYSGRIPARNRTFVRDTKSCIFTMLLFLLMVGIWHEIVLLRDRVRHKIVSGDHLQDA